MTGEAVLIAAQSGRALAGSAARAGYVPLVADLFCDLDTQAAARRCVLAGDWRHGLRPRRLLAALEALAAGHAPIGLVCGSGFEDRPGLLDAAGGRHALLGNSAETVRRAKDPVGFAELCRRHAIAHPEIGLTPGIDWLVKRAGGAGGAHIAHGPAGRPVRRGRYAQRRVSGRAVSALFLGDGQAGAILGFSSQWADPLPRRPYRYGGAVRPAAIARSSTEAMAGAIGRLIPALALRGLNSADFMLRDDGFDLIEINPRPGATLDIFPDADGRLFCQHVQACRGRLPGPVPPPAGASAAAIVYAPRRLRVPDGFAWPDWTADRPAGGSAVARDAPICTVRADAARPDAACALLAERGEQVRRLMTTMNGTHRR